MNKLLVRRAAPWLVAATALAIVPMDGAIAAPGATSSASSNQTVSTVSSVTVVHTVHSFAALAASAAAGVSSSATSAKDGRQNPTRSGGAYRKAAGSGVQAATPVPLQVPVVAPTAVNGTSGAVKSFSGINSYQSREIAAGGNQFTVTPPDQGLCVGNGFVMESVNDAIRMYDTGGNPLTPPISANAFYGYPPAINRTTGEFGPEPTDPTCYYDPQYGRWFQVMLTLEVDPSTGALTLNNHIDIAVSATNNPLGGWVVYRIAAQDDGTQGSPSHTSCKCIGDYPHIGADQYGFYVTTNEYPWNPALPGVFGNNYNGAQVYVLSKFWLAQNSGSVPLVHLSGLALSNGTPSFTLWPSEVPGTVYDTRNKGTEWFSQSNAAFQETKNPAGMANTIAIWRLTNSKSIDGVPAIALTSKRLSSEVYGVPPQSEQKVGPVPLRDCLLVACLPGVGPSRNEVQGYIDSNDSRMQSAWLAGGHLFTALDTIAEVNGRDQAGVAYFIVNVSGTLSASAISSQGYDAVAGNITYPSIATTAAGTGAMALTLVGSSYYPTAAYMNVGTTGPTGSVIVAKSGAGPDDEFCQYVFYNCAGTSTPTIRPRWGDYGMAQIVGTQVWIGSEFIDQTCTIATFKLDPTCGGTRAPLSNWATRITQVTP